MYVGGFFSMGFATMIAHGYEGFSFTGNEPYRDDKKISFAFGGGGYFIYYFTDMVGIQTGLGFLSTGVRYKWSEGGDTLKERIRLAYMEIPVLARLNIQGFQLGLGIALWVALSAKTTEETPDEKFTSKWVKSDEWEAYHRVNMGPWFNFGYAIEVGPVEIVPSLTWMIHLINDINNNATDISNTNFDGESGYRMRAMNIMINCGVQYGF